MKSLSSTWNEMWNLPSNGDVPLAPHEQMSHIINRPLCLILFQDTKRPKQSEAIKSKPWSNRPTTCFKNCYLQMVWFYSRVSEKGFYFLENKNQAIEFKIPTPTPSYNDPPLLKITHQKGWSIVRSASQYATTKKRKKKKKNVGNTFLKSPISKSKQNLQISNYQCCRK